MPPTQHGQPYRLGPTRWGLRFYDAEGVRRRKSPFPSKSAALQYYRDVIEPELRGETPAAPDLTLAELVEVYLERTPPRCAPQRSPPYVRGCDTPSPRSVTCRWLTSSA
jgi:hypothetical protein